MRGYIFGGSVVALMGAAFTAYSIAEGIWCGLWVGPWFLLGGIGVALFGITGYRLGS